MISDHSSQVPSAQIPDPEARVPGPDIAISVKNLSKKYHLYDSPTDRMKEALHPFRRKYHHDFWALQDVSFEIKKGECFGVIGKNGSGKSTLLQILSGILLPTSGEVVVLGKISAMLELGTGFNPEFTGRDNVHMNSALMGFSSKEIERRLPAIEEFADIGKFIDQPVKTYSSGMFVRLAFATAINVDPDVLVIDEALAVGDVFFRQKCYQRFEQLRRAGVTIILVSHGMTEIAEFCDRALLLERGTLHFIGNASEAVKKYYLLRQQIRMDHIPGKGDMTMSDGPNALHNFQQIDGSLAKPRPEAYLDISNISAISNGWARCIGIALCDKRGESRRVFEQGESACFYFEFELLHDIEVPIGGIVIKNEKNIILHGKSTLEYGASVPVRVNREVKIKFIQEIELRVAAGEYTFDVGLSTISKEIYDNRATYQHALLSAGIHRICHLTNVGSFTVVLRRNHEGPKLMHHGLCDLPGRCLVALDRDVTGE